MGVDVISHSGSMLNRFSHIGLCTLIFNLHQYYKEERFDYEDRFRKFFHY